MKCQNCGYVSFEDAPTCKNCGVSIGGDAGIEAHPEPSSDLQNELFSVPPEGEEEDRPESSGDDDGTFVFSEDEVQKPEHEAVELPDMHIDYEPEAEPDREEDAAAGGPVSATGPDSSREEFIDDDAELSDDLWLEESAGFLYRLGASAVDGLILAFVLAIFGMGALLALGPGEHGLSAFSSSGVFIAFYLLFLLLSLGYFTFFLGWAGRTPGKALLKLDVRRSDGAPMTYTRAFLRWAGYLVSLTFAGLGFFWVLFDERKRGWHDYLSGTWVKDLRHDA